MYIVGILAGLAHRSHRHIDNDDISSRMLEQAFAETSI
jgi:hypothetical protein